MIHDALQLESKIVLEGIWLGGGKKRNKQSDVKLLVSFEGPLLCSRTRLPMRA